MDQLPGIGIRDLQDVHPTAAQIQGLNPAALNGPRQNFLTGDVKHLEGGPWDFLFQQNGKFPLAWNGPHLHLRDPLDCFYIRNSVPPQGVHGAGHAVAFCVGDGEVK